MVGDGRYMDRPAYARISEHPKHRELHEWCQTIGLLPPQITEFRRLQLEHWLWEHRNLAQMQGLVLDIGQPTFPRTWVPGVYRTVGLHGCQIQWDITEAPLRPKVDGLISFPALARVDTIICCEVLEHVDNPFRAALNLQRTLRPGGLLLASSPFLWSYHGHTDGGDPFPDYWRFTDEGWRRLLQEAGFREIVITPAEWTTEGAELFGLLTDWEVMNTRPGVSGYFVEAVR